MVIHKDVHCVSPGMVMTYFRVITYRVLGYSVVKYIYDYPPRLPSTITSSSVTRRVETSRQETHKPSWCKMLSTSNCNTNASRLLVFCCFQIWRNGKCALYTSVGNAGAIWGNRSLRVRRCVNTVDEQQAAGSMDLRRKLQGYLCFCEINKQLL